MTTPMTARKINRTALPSLALTVLLITGTWAQVAIADDLQLQPETPQTDSNPTTSAAAKDILLNGEIKKSEQIDSLQATLNATENAQGNLTPEAWTADDEHRFQLALSKLKGGAKMTSDDFRDLQIGIVGADVKRMPEEQTGTVEGIVPGSPAEKAGLHVGDVQVLNPQQVFHPRDPGRAIWAFTGGRAGTTVNFRILRDGEIKTFSLVRMNIEDIPDPRIRRQYEAWARKLGPSGEGTVLLNDPNGGSTAGSMLWKLMKFVI
jgi:C-terminal processing protease CtpA/Prc